MQKEAAVAIILRKDLEGFEILLIKRRINPNDPWSGDVALPGGRKEEQDEDVLNTVIREVKEEVGIDLSKQKFLVELPYFKPSNPRLPKIKIKPFVYVLKEKKNKMRMF